MDSGWPFADGDDGDTAGADAEERARADEEVADILMAFDAFIPLMPGDAALARPAVEAVARALRDARGPDDPVPGMMTVPALIEDPVARARLADASPGAREALGDLERRLVGVPDAERLRAADRVRTAIRETDRRLGP